NSTCKAEYGHGTRIRHLPPRHRPARAARRARLPDRRRRAPPHLPGLSPRRCRLRGRMAVERIGVVGLGAMGAGIAQVAIEAGFEVVGREVTADLGETAAGRIGHFLTRKVEKGQRTRDERDAAVARLVTTTELADLADCDLVIEAIVEELDAKRALFAELERICRGDAVLATNTSALSVTEIAAATATPERVVGMHFFNPAPLMPLVEVVRAQLSADEAVMAALAIVERLGK